MAEFTDQDRELLDFLKKAFLKEARTSSSRQPWQELFDRQETIEAARSIMAAEAIQGFSGSWASSFSYGDSGSFITDTGLQNPDLPVQSKLKSTKLGERGVPDIDFVPFNVGTNRFGSKGPSLLGHPISFEVIGPTLKTKATDWTWQVDQGLGPNGGDLLTMDVRADGTAATCTTLLQAYNVPNFTIGDVNEPNGGLYLLVSDDGSNPGSIQVTTTPMAAFDPFKDTARYELFRISSFQGSSIEIHPNKSFGRFFDLPGAGTRWIRAITIIKPYVTRLAAIPNGTPGRETTFFFIRPSQAAASDLYPPYDGGNPGDGTWLQGDFTTLGAPGTASAVGDPSSYLGKPLLPIPRPLREGAASVETGAGLVSPTDVGRWKLQTLDITTSDVGKILHIFQVDPTNETHFSQGNSSACLGWFNIVQVVPGFTANDVYVHRVAEVNPESGVVYYGPGPYIQQNLGPENATVYYTVHDAISTLYVGNFDIDKVDSARLKNLIDPKYVQRSEKTFSDPTPGFPKRAFGSTGNRSDRSIFPTRMFGGFVGIPEAENPGNLFDLGFRVVLFPAKMGASGLVPDFDKPITTSEVVIDPSILETQFLTVDYSSGSVTLSHSPPAIAGGDIVPNGIIVSPTSNPRGEVVLFASCVPYSMELGQKGSGERITVKKLGDSRDVDSFSSPIQATIDLVNTTFALTAPYIGPSGIAPNPVEIILDRFWEGPETGVFEIIAGLNEDSPSFGVWGYSSRREVVVGANRVTALGDISSISTVTDPSTSLGLNPTRGVVLRRDVVFHPRSANILSFIDRYSSDITYGSTKRTGVVRFEGATQKTLTDGTVRIEFQPRNQLWQQYGAWVAANKDVGGLFPWIGSDGLFQGEAYFTNGAQGGDGVGTLGVTLDGQVYEMEILPAPGENKAISTSNLFVQPQHRFRLVTKFQIPSIGGATDSVTFLGLVGDGIGNVNNSALSDPIDNTIAYIGLRHVGDFENPLDQWHLIFHNPVTVTTQTINLNLDLDIPYYFVMETTQDGVGLLTVPYRLRVGIFDRNMNPIFQDVFKTGELFLPDPDEIMNYYVGFKYVAGATRRVLQLYYSTLINRIDLKGPEA